MQNYCGEIATRRMNSEHHKVGPCGRVLRTDGSCDNERIHIPSVQPATPATIATRTRNVNKT